LQIRRSCPSELDNKSVPRMGCQAQFWLFRDFRLTSSVVFRQCFYSGKWETVRFLISGLAPSLTTATGIGYPALGVLFIARHWPSNGFPINGSRLDVVTSIFGNSLPTGFKPLPQCLRPLDRFRSVHSFQSYLFFHLIGYSLSTTRVGFC